MSCLQQSSVVIYDLIIAANLCVGVDILLGGGNHPEGS